MGSGEPRSDLGRGRRENIGLTEGEGYEEWLACVLKTGGGRSSSATERKRGEGFELRPRPAVYLFSVHNASRLGQRQEGEKAQGFLW